MVCFIIRMSDEIVCQTDISDYSCVLLEPTSAVALHIQIRCEERCKPSAIYRLFSVCLAVAIGLEVRTHTRQCTRQKLKIAPTAPASQRKCVPDGNSGQALAHRVSQNSDQLPRLISSLIVTLSCTLLGIGAFSIVKDVFPKKTELGTSTLCPEAIALSSSALSSKSTFLAVGFSSDIAHLPESLSSEA